ncbi:hypothetical protein BCR37DRAFT_265261 [Protomyces lactucae-debilis]|uniref:Uncharacterized protein n=1 Tax=Protomyces lactucae-debilis TaxID=2754530 RepID=A0A1Y2FK93_PROLT|nr:uncharacterized protein BCR37DRAFT_265261 [Protomyces lactucae-debilis]ORY84378.1 hypothetical protein BCR37DRAFT_265261 [Protomyces lactucae-debilis]
MLFNSFLSLLAIGVAVADRVVVYSDPVSGNVNEGSLGYAYKQVSATYTATSSRTAVTFLTRHDPRYFYYDDFSFSVSGQINGTINLLANPGFESGSFSPWVLVGQQGLSAAAQVTRSRSHTGVWYVRDGAVGGIDGVSQLVDTIPGQLYDFSFWIAADAGRPALGQVVLSSFDPQQSRSLVRLILVTQTLIASPIPSPCPVVLPLGRPLRSS